MKNRGIPLKRLAVCSMLLVLLTIMGYGEPEPQN